MFPKLYDGGSPIVQTARVLALAAGCLTLVAALHGSIAYFHRPGERTLVRFVVAWALLPVFGLIVLALGAIERSRARRFDPNTEDRQTRIAKGRSRAITRAEFEAQQQERSSGGTDRGVADDPG